MSDSSNKSQDGEKTVFNAELHLMELCKSGSVTLNVLANIEYQQGWSHVVVDLIESIRSLPVEIISLEDGYGQLDMAFNFLKKAREVEVWRAIADAQKLSRYTCMQCGSRGKPRMVGSKFIVTCNHCIAEAEGRGVTGTWLDRY